MALNQTLATRPRQPLTPGAVRAQAREHAAEAQQEFYRHPRFARIARRQKWIDQSQPLNLFLPQADLKTLSHMVRAAWKAGLKTTYDLRTLSAANIEKATISVKKDVRITTEEQAPKLPPSHPSKSPAPSKPRQRHRVRSQPKYKNTPPQSRLARLLIKWHILYQFLTKRSANFCGEIPATLMRR